MADTLREYLIALGFKVDEGSFKKFNAFVAKTAGNVAELGSATVTTGLAIGAMVERIARHYEELYYISQRTDASVSNLKSYGLAAKQVGLTVDQMLAAQEQFSAAQRMNPGIAGLVKGFSSATDKGQQLVDVVSGLKKQFGESGYYAAARVAGLMGLDEPTFRMLWMNLERFKQSQALQKQLMKEAGIDADDAAGKFAAFAQQMNVFTERWSVLGQRIALDFLPHVSAAVQGLDDLLKAFSRFNTEDTEGRAGMVAAIATGALGTYLAKKALGRMLFGAGAGAAGAGAGAAGGAGAGAAAPAAAAAAAKKGIFGRAGGWLFGPWGVAAVTAYEVLEPVDTNKLETQPYHPVTNPGGRKPKGWTPSGETKPTAAPDIGDVKGMNAELVERLRQMRKDMPAEVGGFVIKSGHRTQDEQDKLYENRARNPYPVAKNSQHTLGEAADLKFDTPAGAAWVKAQMEKYKVATPVPGDPIHFEREENRAGAVAKHPFLGTPLAPPAAGGAVTLNQHTEIRVEQGPTATATAQSVLVGQERVNGDAVRNLGAKTR